MLHFDEEPAPLYGEKSLPSLFTNNKVYSYLLCEAQLFSRSFVPQDDKFIELCTNDEQKHYDEQSCLSGKGGICLGFTYEQDALAKGNSEFL